MVNVVIPFVGSSAYTGAWYGRGIGPIHLDNVRCRGSEQRLIDCLYTNNTPGWDCTHSEDASVYCRPSIKLYLIILLPRTHAQDVKQSVLSVCRRHEIHQIWSFKHLFVL